MKVSIGMNLQEGPWGGGNQVMRALANYLREHGVNVCFDLAARDLDILMLTQPRRESPSSAYREPEIFRYLSRVNPRTLVVHRINECDERKGTEDVNRRLLTANLCADHTVFVATWLRDLFEAQGLPCASRSVVLNGSDMALFHARGHRPWDGKEPLRLVTHHWGGHWMKGFDIYTKLDGMLGSQPYRSRFQFTYIGNLASGVTFRHANYVQPTSGETLAALLRQHHVYLTASRNEPGSNHQNEGALCGLPLLYRESGCLPEYCRGFGLPFTADNFEARLQEMAATYDQWAGRMPAYPHTADRMGQAYLSLFEELMQRHEELIARRRPWRRVAWWWRAHVPRRRRVTGATGNHAEDGPA